MEISGMVCGTGGSNLPLPGDPSNIVTLTASGVFGGIRVHWTYPLSNPHAVAHTLLYRATSSDYGTASQIAVVAGNTYFDQSTVDTDTVYYYWIVIVSINGTHNDLIGPASATANPMVDDLLVALTDKIDRGVLATALKTKIDKITTLEDGLTAEASYRVADGEALATAFNGLQATVDDTVSLVLTETTTRSTADSSLASQITTAQSQLGDDLASAQVSLSTNITTVAGHVTSIGALYTVKVDVNGMVGGFGVYNDGTEIQAGFLVDTFWVGRTSADKKKPFIISDGIVYIDNAMIHQLTADKIDTRGLTIKASDGTLILGSGTALHSSYAAPGTKNSDLTGSIASAAATAVWANVSGSGKPENNATWGANFDTNMQGKIRASNIWSYIDTGIIGSAFIENAAISNAKIQNLSVDTIKIGNNAVSSMASLSGSGGWHEAWLYAGGSGILSVVACHHGFVYVTWDPSHLYVHVNDGGFMDFQVQANPNWNEYGFAGYDRGWPMTQVAAIGVGAGWHKVSAYCPDGFSLVAILTVR